MLRVEEVETSGAILETTNTTEASNGWLPSNDPWPPLIHDAIVWVLVALVVAYFIGRVLQECSYDPGWLSKILERRRSKSEVAQKINPAR